MRLTPELKQCQVPEFISVAKLCNLRNTIKMNISYWELREKAKTSLRVYAL